MKFYSKMYLSKRNIFLNTIYIATISLFNLNYLDIKATEYKKDIEPLNNIIRSKEQENTEYILGEGDELEIKFYGLSLFNDIYTINPEGNLILPELYEVYAKGKTLKELKNLLYKKYEEFIISPDISIEIVNYRDLNLSLRGEVNQTGFFRLSTKETNNYMPRLFDLLKKGKGVTSNADLQNIVVIRNNPLINGGGKIKAEINLIKFLDEGDQTQNIQLRDGDDVIVGKSNNTIIEQLIAFNKSNLNPSEITVFVNGNVEKSGRLTIKQGASLYQAIAAAGEKDLSGNIELIRLSDSGRNERRTIAFNKLNPKGTYKNPFLINGDIITVKRNILGKTTQAIKQYGAPIINSYAIYRIFEKL